MIRLPSATRDVVCPQASEFSSERELGSEFVDKVSGEDKVPTSPITTRKTYKVLVIRVIDADGTV